MSVVTIKRENWKGKYVYVAREKGKLKEAEKCNSTFSDTKDESN